MADTKISALTAASAAALANEMAVNDAGTTKKVTGTQLNALFGIYKAVLGSAHAISSTTGTEVLQLSLPGAGVYTFDIMVLAQTATTTVAVKLGVNYTGTYTADGTRFFCMAPSSSTTTSTNAVIDDVSATAQWMTAIPHLTFTTTAGNLLWATGYTTTGTDIIHYIRGILTATGAGDLELWHGSETATSTTVSAGTSIIAVKYS
jgi:hypothetical protein